MTSTYDVISARFSGLHAKKIDLSLGRIERLLASTRIAAPPHAAGRSRRRHQRQGLDHRLHARRPRSGGQAGSRLHLAPSRALQRAHPPRRSAGRRRRARGRARALRARQCGRERSRCSRSPPPPPSCCSARRPPTTLLLEVGLGGRFDATNVIDRPAATVITPISIDHPEFLGSTIDQIAFEKAGILKKRRNGDHRRAGRGRARRARARGVAGRRPETA